MSDRRLDLRRHLVHRVRAQDEEVGARASDGAGGIRQDFARLFPLARVLQLLDLVEVHAVERDLRRVQPAQALADDPVDGLVVRDRRLPAHAADEPDGLHAQPPRQG